ncbi:Uncharacterised protein [Klebsiella pneumoniae]|nr:Uncharacterised protein [Klebsiella pneumoniae]
MLFTRFVITRNILLSDFYYNRIGNGIFNFGLKSTCN